MKTRALSSGRLFASATKDLDDVLELLDVVGALMLLQLKGEAAGLAEPGDGGGRDDDDVRVS